MQKIRIEPFQPKHIDEVYEISKEAFPLPWSKEELLKETYNETAVNLVSLIDDEVVGYLQCWYTFDEADLINIAVKSSHKREGIAHAMMIYLLEILRQKGIANIFLEVRVSNIPAQKLYESFRFKIVNRRKRYYINGEDAFIMSLDL